MNRINWTVAMLCASTAAHAQAQEISKKATPLPVSAIDAEDIDGNVKRLEDIMQVCTVNNGGAAFGSNATPGIVEAFQVRGLNSEYGGRYSRILSPGEDGLIIGPNGLPITAEQLQRIEVLQRPADLNCEPPSSDGQTDPSLAVVALPDDVKSGRSLMTAAQVRAELDGIVDLCRTISSEEDGKFYRERYEWFFDKLRVLRAIRDDLRLRLATNAPDFDRQDALNQLKKLDPAIDGAIFPSQLKCPPVQAELARAQSEPDILYREYSPTVGTNYLVAYAGLSADQDQPIEREGTVYLRPDIAADNGIRFEAEANGNDAESYGDSLGSASFGPAYGKLDIGTPSAGIGFQSTGPGSETFASTPETDFDSFTIGGRIEFGIADAVSGFGSYSYSEGDARQDFDIPAGGPVDVGFVYGERSPSGSTGVNVGNRGLTGFNESDFNLHEIKFGVTTPIANQNGFSAFASAFANVLLFDMDFNGQAQSTVFGSVLEQTRNQSVSSDYFGVGAGLSARQEIGPGVALAGSVAGGVYYRDSSLVSMEWNSCALCPPADRNFTVDIEESDSGAAFAGSVSAALEFELSDSLTASLGVDASYLSDVGSVFNPSSGDQVLNGDTTRLEKTDAYRLRGFLQVRLRY